MEFYYVIINNGVSVFIEYSPPTVSRDPVIMETSLNYVI